MMRTRFWKLSSFHRARFHHHQNIFYSSSCSSFPTATSSTCNFLSNRSLLAISGPDSTRYLQGAITRNINSNSSNGFYSVFLNAQGRILHDVFIYPFQEFEGRYKGEPGWLVEVDTKEVESLVKRIKRYRLDSKFEIRAVSQTERSVWVVSSDNIKEDQIEQLFVPNENKNYSEYVIGCVDRRAPGMGYRLLLPGNKKPEPDLVQCNEDYYRVRRYLKGVPEGQTELVKEQALPQESNIDVMGGIDYRKGCYIGQELTIRTHHTGVVRKRILPLQIYGVDEKEPNLLTFSDNINFGAENIPPNTTITRWNGTGRSVGKWLAGIGNIGLGLCRLSNMTEIEVEGEGKSYKMGDEFKVEWESNVGMKTVKVKAFAPLFAKPFLKSDTI
ncbi:putative folate-binding protein [Erysiphe necator]|uniref:Iron-sulfur cluster assembly factor IBA57 homolog, mitochondrial n=1 Tax=Uncinula necator TaxID=52586 RepID=A0A0B1P702_UNCNE|nr:putative folate-binding protein [Erysiphe necator]